jgi:hypothetical protein
MVDASTILEYLSAASTLAVILGLPFVLLQMRQNTRVIEAANRQVEVGMQQTRTSVFLSLAERISDRDFVMQRREIRQIVARHRKEGWEEFSESADAFEVRAFAGIYESAGTLARLGMIDEDSLVQSIGYLLLSDWRAVEPALHEFENVWKIAPYPNFRRLAEASERHLRTHGRADIPLLNPPNPA